MQIGIGKLDLLDVEFEGLKNSGYFTMTGDGRWILDIEKAKKDFAGLGLSPKELEVYIYREYVFQSEDFYFGGEREIIRRIAAVLYEDRNQARNVANMVNRINKKMESDPDAEN